ncbi:unnamed protein product [Miscanthus lutarioriparius]|uniref:Uncharacterized protein n=1 Tax=Miscanthus lutarioriparius TaxID=422564 RepID=A0A811RBZ3_9POAL|nr:unnamed protein product [Miscanthus lutarioriparius]
MPQSFLLLPSFLPPASLVRVASRRPPPPPPSLTALRLHRIYAKLSPPLLAASHSRPGGFHGYGDSGGSDGGSGGDGGRGMDSPDPGDGGSRPSTRSSSSCSCSSCLAPRPQSLRPSATPEVTCVWGACGR